MAARPRRALLVPVFAAALAGCGDEASRTVSAVSTERADGTSAAGAEPDDGLDVDALDAADIAAGAQPTFYRDVAPIFAAKCLGCHRQGGIAPFALDDYAAAAARGVQIADYTEQRVMPPFSMQTGGECGSFDESPALDADQLAVIGAWGRGARAAGAVRPLSPPVLPTLQDAAELALPAFTPEVQGSELAAFDEYRCFLVDPGLSASTFITGYDVQPGAPTLVHHVLAFLVDPARITASGLSNREVMQALHAADPNPERDGWSCYGAAGEGVRVEGVPITWGPGQGVVRYADGIGVPVDPGWQLVVQVHYNLAQPASRGQRDQTRLRLELTPSVAGLAAFVLEDPLLDSLESQPVQLAPGQPSVKYVWEKTGRELGVPEGLSTRIISLMPHMHERGRKFTFELDNGGGYACQGKITRWDFNWQRHYDYLDPPLLTADSRVRVTCDYDTRGAEQPILPGWGTRDEMCLATLMLALGR